MQIKFKWYLPCFYFLTDTLLGTVSFACLWESCELPQMPFLFTSCIPWVWGTSLSFVNWPTNNWLSVFKITYSVCCQSRFKLLFVALSELGWPLYSAASSLFFDLCIPFSVYLAKTEKSEERMRQKKNLIKNFLWPSKFRFERTIKRVKPLSIAKPFPTLTYPMAYVLNLGKWHRRFSSLLGIADQVIFFLVRLDHFISPFIELFRKRKLEYNGIA